MVRIRIAAHGIATARALLVHPTAGVFAGLGLGLKAVLTTLLVPHMFALFL